MTILEMIAVWRSGCSIGGPAAYPPSESPADCFECTEGLVDAIERHELERIKSEVEPLKIETYVAAEGDQAFARFKELAGEQWVHVLVEILDRAIEQQDLQIRVNAEIIDWQSDEALLDCYPVVDQAAGLIQEGTAVYNPKDNAHSLTIGGQEVQHRLQSVIFDVHDRHKG